MSIDWNSIKFRASSWGNLMTEPKTKEEKVNGTLSKTCQMELIRIYNQEVYGRKKEIVTKQMDKGIQVEPDAINLLSIIDGKLYYKNDMQLSNEWFTGHPDIHSGEDIFNSPEIGDIKSSWDLDTFMPKLVEEPDKGYIAQMNVYYDLCNAPGGFLAYCLVSAPPNIIESEKRSLLFKMNVATEYAPEYLRAAAELEHLMVFDDIPPEERVIKIPIPRDDELIQKMKDKVPRLREWLRNFHKLHKSQYKQ